MLRRLVLILAATTMLGCRTSQPSIDPFLGRQTVPPPGTSAVPQTDPYYPSAAPRASGAPPFAAPPSTQPPYVPPGSPPVGVPGGSSSRTPTTRSRFGSNFSRPAGATSEPGPVDRSKAVATDARSRRFGDTALARHSKSDGRIMTEGPGGSPSVRPSQVASPSVPSDLSRRANTAPGDLDISTASLADSSTTPFTTARPAGFQVNTNAGARTPGVQTASHISSAADKSDGIPVEPNRFEPTDELFDIMDFPAPRSSQQVRRARVPDQAAELPRTVEWQQSSAQSAAAETSLPSGGVAKNIPATSAGPSSQPEYDRATDYGWLKGKLEFSESDQQWKLRYIPIDGETDSFGGSVVLPDSPQWEDFGPGEFVAVEGTIGRRGTSGSPFAPTYDVARVKRL